MGPPSRPLLAHCLFLGLFRGRGRDERRVWASPRRSIQPTGENRLRRAPRTSARRTSSHRRRIYNAPLRIEGPRVCRRLLRRERGRAHREVLARQVPRRSRGQGKTTPPPAFVEAIEMVTWKMVGWSSPGWRRCRAPEVLGDDPLFGGERPDGRLGGRRRLAGDETRRPARTPDIDTDCRHRHRVNGMRIVVVLLRLFRLTTAAAGEIVGRVLFSR
jgi:hypothetical protein